MTVLLPQLPYHYSPNQSSRPKGVVPHLIVLHSWGNPLALTPATAKSRFNANVNYLSNPNTPYQASAHVVYGGCIGDPHGLATQLVPWDQKAWTEMSFNSVSYSIESADAIWALRNARLRKGDRNFLKTYDEAGLLQLARIVGFLCTKTQIPPSWSRKPLTVPGIVRHYDLGLAGGGHYDPTTNNALWMRFIYMVKAQVKSGGYRGTWGKGRLKPINL